MALSDREKALLANPEGMAAIKAAVEEDTTGRGPSTSPATSPSRQSSSVSTPTPLTWTE